MTQQIKPKKIYLKTLGWPMVTVARDGAGCVKEGKWFGVKGLGQIRPKGKNIFNVI